ncbi:hypothetical protein LCGC14_1446080 [marine sediment metagenome]|uniref:Phage terminase small subunit P27 family n=1 Tax=marine sediment metagenome TaxID=412755 RepID=A0A0F9JJX4_9ZZZZ|nr:hypothetical protein [Desulfobacterales bacterium]
MARGRLKTSDSKNKLHGNPGRRKRKKQSFTASDDRFGIPKGLSEIIRREVRQFANSLKEKGLAVENHRSDFRLYCEHLQNAYDANQTIKKEGMIVVDERGLSRKHPANQIFKDNSVEAMRIKRDIERLVKDIEPPEKDNPLKEFMNRGGRPYKV